MKNLKTFENYSRKEVSKINEGLGTLTFVSIVYTVIRLLRVLSMDWILRRQLKATREYELEKEIKDICGYDLKIYSFDKNKNWSSVAFAIQEIFIEREFKESLTHRELIAILLHEASHAHSKDSMKMIIAHVFPILVTGMFSNWLISALGFTASILFHRFTTRELFEPAADDFAIKWGYAKDAASASAKFKPRAILKQGQKLEEKKSLLDNILYKLSRLFASHPEDYKRIQKFCGDEDPQVFLNTLIKIHDEKIESEGSIDDKINLALDRGDLEEVRRLTRERSGR